MANPEHLAVLRDAIAQNDIKIWNNWYYRQRRSDFRFYPDLCDANLSGANLSGANLTAADLDRADLSETNLSHATLTAANLSKAILVKTDLRLANLIESKFIQAQLFQSVLDGAFFREEDSLGADFEEANLEAASFIGCYLNRTKFVNATLKGVNFLQANLVLVKFRGATLTESNFTNAYFSLTDFTDAILAQTTFENVDLSGAVGLQTITHLAPSTVDLNTIFKSVGAIPESFLRGCGTPDDLIDLAKSLSGGTIEYYSVFISYSSADDLFARRLHHDLQANGVRAWFAPEDLKTGDRLKQTIEESINLYDKLIIVLSEDSIHSAWVRHEFEVGLEKEREQHKVVLFPIRLDNSVFDTTEQWADNIRQERYIGDFTTWQNPLSYQAEFNRLLKDLNAQT